jgi:hypothetical protein
VTEHYDTELETALNIDDDPLTVHTMTAAEAAKIRVWPWPSACPSRLRLVHSAVYRVFMRTAAGLTIDFMVNFTPSVQTVETVLSQMEEEIPEPFAQSGKPDYDRDMARLENFIALVRLVPVLHIPTPGRVEEHEVRMAGVNIGTIGVKSLACWDIPEGP